MWFVHIHHMCLFFSLFSLHSLSLIGFDDREIVALSGAHALGRCHEDASGYWGPWTRAESTFSNEYFRLLVDVRKREKKIKHTYTQHDKNTPNERTNPTSFHSITTCVLYYYTMTGEVDQEDQETRVWWMPMEGT
jgi:catalase (peroxidase I)